MWGSSQRQERHTSLMDFRDETPTGSKAIQKWKHCYRFFPCVVLHQSRGGVSSGVRGRRGLPWQSAAPPPCLLPSKHFNLAPGDYTLYGQMTAFADKSRQGLLTVGPFFPPFSFFHRSQASGPATLWEWMHHRPPTAPNPPTPQPYGGGEGWGD